MSCESNARASEEALTSVAIGDVVQEPIDQASMALPDLQGLLYCGDFAELKHVMDEDLSKPNQVSAAEPRVCIFADIACPGHCR